jgi:hypothetical protein
VWSSGIVFLVFLQSHGASHEKLNLLSNIILGQGTVLVGLLVMVITNTAIRPVTVSGKAIRLVHRRS